MQKIDSGVSYVKLHGDVQSQSHRRGQEITSRIYNAGQFISKYGICTLCNARAGVDQDLLGTGGEDANKKNCM